MTGPDLSFDRRLAGKRFPTGSFEVTEEAVVGYCDSVGDAWPGTASGASGEDTAHPVPPTFVLLQALRGISDLARTLGLPERFGDLSTQTGEAVKVLGPVYLGDRIEKRSGIQDAYWKTGRSGLLAFVVWESEFVNQDGAAVAHARMSFMTRP